MSWWEYVERNAPGRPQVAIAAMAGVSSATVSRWAKGTMGVDPGSAAAFARAVGRPVLEAFIAAGYLTASEAGERPAAAPSLASLTDDELLAEMRARLQELRDGQPATNDAANRRHSLSSAPDPTVLGESESEEAQGGEDRSADSTPTAPPDNG